MSKTKTFTVRIDPKLFERLKEASNDQRRPLNNLMKIIIEDYVEQHEQEKKDKKGK